jgi:hypothetical protein
MNRISNPVFTIPSGSSASNSHDLHGQLAGLYFPAAMTGTTVTFEASYDGTNFFGVVKDDGTAYSVTVTTNSYTALTWQYFLGLRYIRVKSGGTEGAARTIYGGIYQS